MTETAGTDDSSATPVVTAFLRNRGEVLLCRRSDAVGTYTGRWGGVSGFAEGNPDEQVRVELAEETGLAGRVSLVRSSRPLEVRDDDIGRTWLVHPYLFDCDAREVELSEEHEAAEWMPATAMLEAERDTVPALWQAYERVAPTVRSTAADGDHGAAWLSLRALEVVRDRAGLLVAEREEARGESVGEARDSVGEARDSVGDARDSVGEARDSADGSGNRSSDESGNRAAEWDELADLAGRLLEVRPSMAVLRNRVNRAMADAESRDATGVLESTIAGIDRAAAADDEAASRAGALLEGPVATLSRSGTVLDALGAGEPTRVYVAESRPAGEGVAVAESLATEVPVTLHTDAAAATILAREEVERVVVGADTILPDGSVVNKTGTRGLAIAAVHEGIPVTAVASSDKVSTREAVSLESDSGASVYDGDASVDVANPTFDVTPAACVSEIVTEDGVVEPSEVSALAEELRALEGWHGE